MDMDELGSLRNMTRQNGHGYVANCYDDQVVVAMVTRSVYCNLPLANNLMLL